MITKHSWFYRSREAFPPLILLQCVLLCYRMFGPFLQGFSRGLVTAGCRVTHVKTESERMNACWLENVTFMLS